MADQGVRAQAAPWSRGFDTLLEGTAVLTENTGMPGATTRQPLLSEDEASQFRALRAALPDAWVAELQSEAGMTWVAFVYQADGPRGRPMFSVCRWDDGVGLFTQWMDGSVCSAMAFTELWPVLEQIVDALACTQPHREVVPTESWANAQH